MASTESIVRYYSKLLILQYLQKPKARATVEGVVTPVIMDQLPTKIQGAFALESAVGVQLDVIGKYVGVTRDGYSFTGPIVLNDADYRTLIKIKIIQNNSGSSLATIQQFLFDNFNMTVFVVDYQSMRLSYLIDPAIGSLELAQVLVTKKLLPKPMAVQLSSIIYTPFITTLFGFRTYQYAGYHNSPFNSYSDYHMDYPWLTYAYTI